MSRARRTPARTLSASGWRLVEAYDDELKATLRGPRGERTMARELRALAAYYEWLITHDVDLPSARPEDLHAYRLSLSGGARDHGFDAVRRLYRFLYCRRLLRHDPGALFDLERGR